VIRHGIDDLSDEEQADFGRVRIGHRGTKGKSERVGVDLRMDRASRLAKRQEADRSGATNDVRFHVGWRHLDAERKELRKETSRLTEPVKAVIAHHLEIVQRLLGRVGVHPKMEAVGAVVKEKVKEGEKVVLFCHHHATAQELTAHLGKVLPKVVPPRAPRSEMWRRAWRKVFPEWKDDHLGLCDVFIGWLCSDLIRGQTWEWLGVHQHPPTVLPRH